MPAPLASFFGDIFSPISFAVSGRFAVTSISVTCAWIVGNVVAKVSIVSCSSCVSAG